MSLGLISASGNPSEATIDEIMNDAVACANSAATGIGGIAKAGMNMYNAMYNMFSPPPSSGMMGQNTNPYSANMGQVQTNYYAYAEGGMGYGNSYLNITNPQWAMGYPGFADPEYGFVMPGYGGRI